MKIFEKLFPNNAKLLLVAIVLSGCSSENDLRQPESSPTLRAVTVFCEPHDDILSRPPLCQTSSTRAVSIVENFASVGPAGGRICNKSKTYCELGIVANKLYYTIQKTNGDNIEVSGNLDTQVGRSGSLDSNQAGYTFSFSKSLDDNVHLIKQNHQNINFHQTVKIGQSIKITGLVGSSVTLFFLKE